MIVFETFRVSLKNIQTVVFKVVVHHSSKCLFSNHFQIGLQHAGDDNKIFGPFIGLLSLINNTIRLDLLTLVNLTKPRMKTTKALINLSDVNCLVNAY